MHDQRKMLAQLLQKIPFTVIEALRPSTSNEEYAKYLALGFQRRQNQGSQSADCQRACEWEIRLADIGCVHQLPSHAVNSS
jgi:hypothetical protein